MFMYLCAPRLYEPIVIYFHIHVHMILLVCFVISMIIITIMQPRSGCGAPISASLYPQLIYMYIYTNYLEYCIHYFN